MANHQLLKKIENNAISILLYYIYIYMHHIKMGTYSKYKIPKESTAYISPFKPCLILLILGIHIQKSTSEPMEKINYRRINYQ